MTFDCLAVVADSISILADLYVRIAAVLISTSQRRVTGFLPANGLTVIMYRRKITAQLQLSRRAVRIGRYVVRIKLQHSIVVWDRATVILLTEICRCSPHVRGSKTRVY